ncbi:MAG: hypothetical protein JWM68_4859 [Verrucomicrobiales bacterium]|nr:hypothetical protein [Verrucomicrobiales bacterium]
MWTSQLHQIDRQTTQGTLGVNARPLSFREVIELWCVSAEFRNYFTSLLVQSPFDAFFWETPSVTDQTVDRPFKFVLVDAPSLSRVRPDPAPFKGHFASRGSEEVLTFSNLGGDAILVVPAPIATESCYTHLAQFLRKAPGSQVDSFWRSVGVAMRERISAVPTWLSTAGLGVSWLHLRLDSRPKYYRHEPYKANNA